MNPISQAFALLAALLHVMLSGMESVWFMRSAVYRRFGAKTVEDAQARRLFAFNQGFYNLFLALGVLAGLALLHVGGNAVVGRTLVLFGCACMAGAGIVLFLSAGRRMLLAAVMQAIFPLLAWVAWLAC